METRIISLETKGAANFRDFFHLRSSERSSSLSPSYGRGTGHFSSSQPFISLFTSQSFSGDLYSTALTDLERHILGVASTAMSITSQLLCRCLNLFDSVWLETKTISSPLDNAKGLDVLIKRHQNFCFLTGDGEFRHPLVVVQGITAYPFHPLHEGSESLHQVLLRVSLSVTSHGFCVDRHARCESGTHPCFFFPTFNFCPSLPQRGRTRMWAASTLIPSCFGPFHSAEVRPRSPRLDNELGVHCSPSCQHQGKSLIGLSPKHGSPK